jgi:RNA polymerase primary sigma factor
MVEKIRKIKNSVQEMEKEESIYPDMLQVAEDVDIPEETVKRAFQIALQPISLETPIGDETSLLGDFIMDAQANSPEDVAIDASLKREINKLLLILSERERKVLELRFGLNHGQTHTLEQVGQYFGLTRERIRQIEAKALQKLRLPKRSRVLKDFMV